MKELIPPTTIYTTSMVAYEESLAELSPFDEKTIKANLNTESSELVLKIALTLDGAKEKFRDAIHGKTATICYEIHLPKEQFHEDYEFVENYDLQINNPKLLDPENIKAAYILSSHKQKDIGEKIVNPQFEEKSSAQPSTLSK